MQLASSRWCAYEFSFCRDTSNIRCLSKCCRYISVGSCSRLCGMYIARLGSTQVSCCYTCTATEVVTVWATVTSCVAIWWILVGAVPFQHSLLQGMSTGWVPEWAVRHYQETSTWQIAASYGLFRSMTGNSCSAKAS